MAKKMIDASDAARKAVTQAGGACEVARQLGCSPAAVAQWYLLSRRVPAYRVEAIAALSGIPREELRPDLFPNGKVEK